MSLRTFHLLFILFAIVGADLFAAWSVWFHRQSGGEPLILTLGILSAIGGLGLIVYAYRLTRSLEQLPRG